MAQVASAPAWGAGGRWFKSSRPDFYCIILNFFRGNNKDAKIVLKIEYRFRKTNEYH